MLKKKSSILFFTLELVCLTIFYIIVFVLLWLHPLIYAYDLDQKHTNKYIHSQRFIFCGLPQITLIYSIQSSSSSIQWTQSELTEEAGHIHLYQSRIYIVIGAVQLNHSQIFSKKEIKIMIIIMIFTKIIFLVIGVEAVSSFICSLFMAVTDVKSVFMYYYLIKNSSNQAYTLLQNISCIIIHGLKKKGNNFSFTFSFTVSLLL